MWTCHLQYFLRLQTGPTYFESCAKLKGALDHWIGISQSCRPLVYITAYCGSELNPNRFLCEENRMQWGFSFISFKLLDKICVAATPWLRVSPGIIGKIHVTCGSFDVRFARQSEYFQWKNQGGKTALGGDEHLKAFLGSNMFQWKPWPWSETQTERARCMLFSLSIKELWSQSIYIYICIYTVVHVCKYT